MVLEAYSSDEILWVQNERILLLSCTHKEAIEEE